MSKRFAKLVRNLLNGTSEKPIKSEVEVKENLDAYPFNEPSAMASDFVRLRTRAVEFHIGRPRASSLYSCCIRKHVLGKRARAVSKEALSVHQRLLFGFGTAVHLWLQNEPDVFGNRRRGFWKCMACGKVSQFGPPPVQNCKHCGALPSAFQYHELAIRSDDPPVSGHPDMFLARHTGSLRVAEFKTIEGDRFAKLQGPDPDHIWQVSTYVYLCSKHPKLKKVLDPGLGYVFYFTKKQQTGVFPCRAFPVRVTEDSMAPILAKLATYQRAQDEPGWLPVLHSECRRSDFGHYRAQTCEVLQECQKND